jgi:hypothetical protein
MKTIASVALALTVLTGCGSLNPMTWWRGDPEEQRPARLLGAVFYQCEAKKSLALRHAPQGQDWVMVILPDREFRLDPQGANSGRYTNGKTTLSTQGDVVTVEEGGAPMFAGCKRAA